MGTKLYKKLQMWLMSRRLINNTYGGLGPKSVVTLGVSLFLIAIIFPLAMTQIQGANTTGWDTAVITIFTVVLPILAIIGVAMKYIPRR